MTTTVIVKTHAWPARVQTFPLRGREPIEGAEWSAGELVEPNSERTFHVHDGQDVCVRELPIPAGHNCGPALDA